MSSGGEAPSGQEGLWGPTNYSLEPGRDPDLIVNSKEPYNAETRGPLLGQQQITPAHAFYVRNHGPVPVLLNADTFRLRVEGLLTKPLSLSLADIRSLPKIVISAALQCAGNRRTEMSLKRKVRGVGWGLGAVGNAQWGGASLAGVLELAGVPQFSVGTREGGAHVEFVSVDACKEEDGGPYKASLPLVYATNPLNQVLLAYEMNGQDLTRDHGFPLRLIAPGIIGARSVKWLSHIVVGPTESQGFFMQRDYKMFPPTVDWDNVRWASRSAIMDFPVQSAITWPEDGARLAATGEEVVVRGYALAGGGRRVERVDVSADGGCTWAEARLLGQGASPGYGVRTWEWSLWELRARITPPATIVVKAVDEASNTQPEGTESIWNLRGVLNNSWHSVRVLSLAARASL